MHLHFSEVDKSVYTLYLIYLDDTIASCRTFHFDIHLKCLTTELRKLREADCRIEAPCQKVQFCWKRGEVVTEKGICPDSSKIETVRNFPVPNNLKQLCQSLGLANLFLDFNQLLHKQQKQFFCQCTEACQKTFELQTERLVSCPILAYPDFFPTIPALCWCFRVCYWSSSSFTNSSRKWSGHLLLGQAAVVGGTTQLF